ncbi:hypothetical protein [Mycolicibacterium fallax]|uniref:hypothetical protein n=1 Tax=Mycolicibacterium fallax TaxID=1793 RepID=UPI0013D80840|nr:hypothetical protein [Mycolicibacterium fallax]
MAVSLLLQSFSIAAAEGNAAYGGYGDCSPGFELPGYDATESTTEEPIPYEYDALDPSLAELPEPTAKELGALNERAGIKGGKNSNVNTPEGVKARWKRYLRQKQAKRDKGENVSQLDWQEWLDSYIQLQTNRRVGPAFETFLKDGLWKLDDTWIANKKLSKSIPGVSTLPGPNSVLDLTNISNAVPKQLWTLVEAKSGASLGDHARKQFFDHMKRAGELGAKVVLMFGEKPTDATLKWLADAVDELRKTEGVKMPPGFCAKYIPSKAYGRGQIPADPTSPSPIPVLDESAATPEMQRELAEMAAQYDQDEAEAEEQSPASEPTQPAETPPTEQAPATAQVPVTSKAPIPARPTAPVNAPAPIAAPETNAPAESLPDPAGAPPPVIYQPAPANAPPPVIYQPAPANAPPPVIYQPAPANAPPPPVYQPAPASGPVAPSSPVSGPATTATGDLGGIDFSTLEMRYVSDSAGGKPLTQYAFRADALAQPVASYGGRRNADMAMDAFFVWMAVSPEKFWVNLKESEPDRIVDSVFGKTEAGRVLLVADLEMKKESARLQKNDTELGKHFVDALGGRKCYLGRRLWIEPAPAVVHEDGDQLYVIDTPLTVNIGHDDSDVTPGTDMCDGQDPAVTTSNGKLYESMILPALIDRINNAPNFADLRRVYASRVAAEWYRKRNAVKPSQYSKIINSNNVDKWIDPWDPMTVFNSFVHSLHNGEASFSWTDGSGTTWTSTWGGVDFSKVSTTEIGEAEFQQKYAAMATGGRPSINGPVSTDGGKHVWLGSVVSPVPLDQVWSPRSMPWTPYVIAAPAPSRPVFYAATMLPMAIWVVAGIVLVTRRRRRGMGA